MGTVLSFIFSTGISVKMLLGTSGLERLEAYLG